MAPAPIQPGQRNRWNPLRKCGWRGMGVSSESVRKFVQSLLPVPRYTSNPSLTGGTSPCRSRWKFHSVIIPLINWGIPGYVTLFSYRSTPSLRYLVLSAFATLYAPTSYPAVPVCWVRKPVHISYVFQSARNAAIAKGPRATLYVCWNPVSCWITV